MKATTGTAVVIDANKVLMPAGVYWLGDPCYFVPNDRWMEWLEAAEFEKEDNLFALLDDRPVLGFHTAYGDGAYPGSDGFTYGVDAGLIGLVPVEIAGEVKTSDRLGTMIVFDAPTLCTNSPSPARGLMRFGDVTIDTRDEDSNDEDEDGGW